MSIKKVSVVRPNGEHTIITSRPKAVLLRIVFTKIYGYSNEYQTVVIKLLLK